VVDHRISGTTLARATASERERSPKYSLDGAKEAVAETVMPVPGERPRYQTVEDSAFTEVSDMPEPIEVPRVGKSPYSTNLGGVSGGTYIESICFSGEAYLVSEYGIVCIYL
jgi:hypothetical protein